MQAMINFSKAMLKMPRPWVVWVGLLVTVSRVAPLFFMATLEAREKNSTEISTGIPGSGPDATAKG